MKLSWDWLDPGAIMISLEGLGASPIKLGVGLGLGDMVVSEGLGVAFEVELCVSDVEFCVSEGLGDMVVAELGVAFEVELCVSEGLGELSIEKGLGLDEVEPLGVSEAKLIVVEYTLLY